MHRGKERSGRPVMVAGIIVLAMLLACQQTTALLPTFTSGAMELRLDKYRYTAGEDLLVEVEIQAFESPIVDGYIAFQLVDGPDVPEPYSQDSWDNVILEQVERGIHVWPKTVVKRRFSVPIPTWARPGPYRLDGYLKTTHSPVTGVPFIYFTPTQSLTPCQPHFYCPHFVVENPGPWTSLRMLRNETYFAHEIGPVGPRVDPGSEQPFNVTFLNEGAEALDDVELRVGIYDWDDTEPVSGLDPLTPSIPLNVARHHVGTIGPGEVRVINGTFRSPDRITAYTILIEAFADERLLSVYRSRIDVVGDSGRIARLTPHRPLVNRGQDLNISVEFVSPADRQTDLEGAEFAIQVEDERGHVWKSSSPVTVSSGEGVLLKRFQFQPQRRLINWTLTGTLSLKGVSISSLAVHLDKEKFPPNVTQVRVTARSTEGALDTIKVGDGLILVVELTDEDGFRGKGKVDVGVYDPTGYEVIIAEGRDVEEPLMMGLEVRENWAGDIVVVVNDTGRRLTGTLPLRIAAPPEERAGDTPADEFIPVKESGGDTDVEEPETPPGGLDLPWPEPTNPWERATPAPLRGRTDLDTGGGDTGGGEDVAGTQDVAGRGGEAWQEQDRGPSIGGFIVFFSVFLVVGILILVVLGRGVKQDVTVIKGVDGTGSVVAAPAPTLTKGSKTGPKPAAEVKEKPASSLRKGSRGKSSITRAKGSKGKK